MLIAWFVSLMVAHADKLPLSQLTGELPVRSVRLVLAPELEAQVNASERRALEDLVLDLVTPVGPDWTDDAQLELILAIEKAYGMGMNIHDFPGRLYLRNAQGQVSGRALRINAFVTSRAPHRAFLTFPDLMRQIDHVLGAPSIKRSEQIARELLRGPTCGERVRALFKR